MLELTVSQRALASFREHSREIVDLAKERALESREEIASAVGWMIKKHDELGEERSQEGAEE